MASQFALASLTESSFCDEDCLINGAYFGPLAYFLPRDHHVSMPLILASVNDIDRPVSRPTLSKKLPIPEDFLGFVLCKASLLFGGSVLGMIWRSEVSINGSFNYWYVGFSVAMPVLKVCQQLKFSHEHPFDAVELHSFYSYCILSRREAISGSGTRLVFSALLLNNDEPVFCNDLLALEYNHCFTDYILSISSVLSEFVVITQNFRYGSKNIHLEPQDARIEHCRVQLTTDNGHGKDSLCMTAVNRYILCSSECEDYRDVLSLALSPSMENVVIATRHGGIYVFSLLDGKRGKLLAYQHDWQPQRGCKRSVLCDYVSVFGKDVVIASVMFNAVGIFVCFTVDPNSLDIQMNFTLHLPSYVVPGPISIYKPVISGGSFVLLVVRRSIFLLNLESKALYMHSFLPALPLYVLPSFDGLEVLCIYRHSHSYLLEVFYRTHANLTLKDFAKSALLCGYSKSILRKLALPVWLHRYLSL